MCQKCQDEVFTEVPEDLAWGFCIFRLYWL
jgi:hypothetical protein